MFPVVIDAFSKCLEVSPLSAATSTVTIQHLCSIFATHGLPRSLVTDNGPQFTSAEFEAFMKNNGIRHIKSSPYHPVSNGLAERAVQCFKESMKKFPSQTHLKPNSLVSILELSNTTLNHRSTACTATPRTHSLFTVRLTETRVSDKCARKTRDTEESQYPC